MSLYRLSRPSGNPRPGRKREDARDGEDVGGADVRRLGPLGDRRRTKSGGVAINEPARRTVGASDADPPPNSGNASRNGTCRSGRLLHALLRSCKAGWCGSRGAGTSSRGRPDRPATSRTAQHRSRRRSRKGHGPARHSASAAPLAIPGTSTAQASMIWFGKARGVTFGGRGEATGRLAAT